MKMENAEDSFPLSIPRKQVSAWVAETDPKLAREWIATLPMADTGEAAREVYEALYTLNRLSLSPQIRFKLMAMYREPVGSLAHTLKGQFRKSVFPLTEKKRQLAEFIRELMVEMAYGYKIVIVEAEQSRFGWGKTRLKAGAAQWAMHYLGEILNTSYEVYMSCPSGVWREIHGLYHYSAARKWLNGELEQPLPGPLGPVPQITHTYLQNVMLGLANPYQLPEQECRQVQRFLERWAGVVQLSSDLAVSSDAGHFLVDLTADAPPAPFPKDVSLQAVPHLRALNALPLARVVQEFSTKLKDGVSATSLDMGMDCLDVSCREILKRMVRHWGLVARRKKSRTRTNNHCFVAVGIRAIHYFCSGQTPFVSPDQREGMLPATSPSVFKPTETASTGDDEDFIDIDELALSAEQKSAVRMPSHSPDQVYRVERWRVCDESPGGMMISHTLVEGLRIKVGDVLGIQDHKQREAWRIGVVRWIKTPGGTRLDLGVEMLAPDATAVAVKDLKVADGEYDPALLLPPLPAIKRPATLILPRGHFDTEKPLRLVDHGGAHRSIKSLELLERTAACDHIVFADLAEGTAAPIASLA